MPDDTQQSSQRPKQHRGFAMLSPERRRKIASAGGKAAWRRGVAHRWTAAEASAAGLKSAEKRDGAFCAPKEEASV